jgi:polar amino acid transport system ATP-binding protein
MIWQLDNLTRRYGAQLALAGLNHTTSTCSGLVLIGPSGGGKSTLLRHLAGLEVPDAGRLWLNGELLGTEERTLRPYRSQNGFLFQSYNLFPHLTVRENITLPLIKVHHLSPAEAQSRAEAQLRRFAMWEHADKLPRQLSGGQQQRAALIRATARRPKILFLDEPTAALDPEMTHEVLDLVLELIRDGLPVVCCTHEMTFARAAAQEVIFMAEGQIVVSGPVEPFFTNPPTERIRRFLGV